MAKHTGARRYHWTHNPASILETIDLHLRFRVFRRTDLPRQNAISELAVKLGISPHRKVKAAVDAVGVLDPVVRALSPRASAALHILWNLHPKARWTPCPLPPLRPTTAVLVQAVQETLEYLWPVSRGSIPERESLVALLGELFKIDEQKAKGVAARLLDNPATRAARA
jgi:hypothetical protein